MKYAFNTASAPHLTLAELLAAARRYGYDGLEIRSGAGHAHGIETTADAERRAELRHEAEEAGVALTALGISSRFTTAEDQEGQITAAAQAILLARDMGIPYVRLFCGRLVPGCAWDESLGRVLTALDRLAPIAADEGVMLLLETHDDWSAPHVLADLLRRANHPSLGVLWDVLHTQHEGRALPGEVVRMLGPWIKHVHVHDGVAGSRANGHPDYRAIGSGDIRHAEVIRSLRAIGYTGYLSGEWFQWEPYDLHLPREREALELAERLSKEGEADGF
ncbi:sugar phosphate isomerase/epimerase family protein [Paenibacillus sp. NPDC058174]|uniref:sugar phosphate isomerase/epimerase family protein n=1 Tax=Paenibacillus sp. NPDC058174 TaxID=3346366 RepID=UPI0036DBD5CA